MRPQAAALLAAVAVTNMAWALDPCTDSRVGPVAAVTELVKDHAWAAGVPVPDGATCADVMRLLRTSAPVWAEMLEAEEVVLDPATSAATEVPAWSLASLASTAAGGLAVARNASFAGQLAPACTAGPCTPAQAIATDALAGSLRLRDEPGWTRVGTRYSGIPLRFPADHLLREDGGVWHVAPLCEWLSPPVPR